jgi:hypothetical protein
MMSSTGGPVAGRGRRPFIVIREVKTMARIKHKLINAEPDDPMRCQGQGQSGEGQCHWLSLAGMARDGHLDDADIRDYTDIDRCPKHGGFIKVNQREKKALHDYRLQVWQERINEFCESPKVKSLRGEIAIVRMLTETILSMCEKPQDLMLYSGKIGDLVMKIEKLVRSCDRLESSMGMLLDRAGALVLAGQIVEIISKHVTEPHVIDEISNGIIDAISSLTGEK